MNLTHVRVRVSSPKERYEYIRCTPVVRACGPHSLGCGRPAAPQKGGTPVMDAEEGEPLPPRTFRTKPPARPHADSQAVTPSPPCRIHRVGRPYIAAYLPLISTIANPFALSGSSRHRLGPSNQIPFTSPPTSPNRLPPRRHAALHCPVSARLILLLAGLVSPIRASERLRPTRPCLFCPARGS